MISDVLQYLTDNNRAHWSIAEIIDIFKFDQKQRFDV